MVYNFKVEFEFSLDVISFFPTIFAEAGYIGQGRNVSFPDSVFDIFVCLEFCASQFSLSAESSARGNRGYMIILLISPAPVLIGLSVCHLAVDANLSFESFRVILIVVY